MPRTPLTARTHRRKELFFRLSHYQDQLESLIESETLRISPTPFRNEVLAFARSGLEDISVSRSNERARGWGVAVPNDPSQVIYVWFDALTNYISALDYGQPEAEHYRTGGRAPMTESMSLARGFSAMPCTGAGGFTALTPAPD